MNLDVYCDFNQDLILTPYGSIQTATGWSNIRERIIRNMITNSAQSLPNGVTTAPDYIFVPTFGIGLGSLVGGDFTAEFIADVERRIRQAVFADANVDPGVQPTIIFQQPTPGTLQIFISITLVNGQSGTLSVSMG